MEEGDRRKKVSRKGEIQKKERKSNGSPSKRLPLRRQMGVKKNPARMRAKRRIPGYWNP